MGAISITTAAITTVYSLYTPEEITNMKTKTKLAFLKRFAPATYEREAEREFMKKVLGSEQKANEYMELVDQFDKKTKYSYDDTSTHEFYDTLTKVANTIISTDTTPVLLKK